MAQIDFALPEGPPLYAFTCRYDYDASGNLIYQGWAFSSNIPGPVGPGAETSNVPASGPTTAAAVWAIKKYTYNGSSQLTTSQWVNGNTALAYIWDNRASLSYQ